MPSDFNKNESLPWEEDSNPKIKIKPSVIIALGAVCVLALIICGVIFFLNLILTDPVSPEHIPSVVNIEQFDSYPVSEQELSSGIMRANYQDKLETEFSSINYMYKVTLDNEREFIVPVGGRVYDIGSSGNYLEVNGYIPTNELGEIIRKTDSTVEVTVSAEIRNTKAQYDPIVNQTEAVCEKSIEPCIIKKLKYIGKGPVSVYEYSDVTIIDGGEFEITYGDGRKVVAKPEISENGTYQTLDGHVLNAMTSDTDYDGTEDIVEVTMLDYADICEVKMTVKEFPFSAIEITDCTFDENYKITSLSYKLTYKDGTVRQFKNQKALSDSLISYIIKTRNLFEVAPVHGYSVVAKPEFIYPENSDKAQLKVTLTTGLVSVNQLESSKIFDAPESDCECICHNNGKAEKKLYTTVKPVLEILSVKDYCKCGAYHYEISEF